MKFVVDIWSLLEPIPVPKEVICKMENSATYKSAETVIVQQMINDAEGEVLQCFGDADFHDPLCTIDINYYLITII